MHELGAWTVTKLLHIDDVGQMEKILVSGGDGKFRTLTRIGSNFISGGNYSYSVKGVQSEWRYFMVPPPISYQAGINNLNIAREIIENES